MLKKQKVQFKVLESVMAKVGFYLNSRIFYDWMALFEAKRKKDATQTDL